MTEIFIGDIRVQEPVTVLTDLIVTGVCMYAYFKIKKYRNLRYIQFFRMFFITMALATLWGGVVGHGFIYYFENFSWKLPGWLISMISIFLLERAGIEYTGKFVNEKLLQTMKLVNVVELVIFLFLTFYFVDFRYVEIHSAFGLLVVNFPIYLILYRKTRAVSSRYMFMGIGVMGVSAFIFKKKISLHQWLNHIDISHLLMAVTVLLFYFGTRRMGQLK